MRYLITGGAGFIGGHLTEFLLADGQQVAVVDNFSTGSWDNLQAVAGHQALRIIEADIVTHPEVLEPLISEADVIIHLAAAVGVELVVQDPFGTIITNIHGTENVLKLASEQHKRVIIASTSEVYGKSSKDQFSETDDLIIGSPEHCRWSYACSKLLDEFYLKASYQATGMPGTVVRFFNTVGPRQTGRYGMVIPRFVARALEGKPLQVYGDGNQSRCFCHVFDVVRALKLLVGNPDSYGETYNIGSHHSITIHDLAKEVIRITGSKSSIVFVPYEKAYAKGFEDMRRRMPNTTKLTTLTGWEPEFSLEQIIKDVQVDIHARGRF